MVTSKQCLSKYGYPDVRMEREFMVLWDVPEDINMEIPALPNKIYCNIDLIEPLEKAFRLLIERDLTCHILTWDGCFNIRKKRGLKSWSIHAWALAIDINAAWNGLGDIPNLPFEVVDCFKEAGFDWGGDWEGRPDGMHFQLSNLDQNEL